MVCEAIKLFENNSDKCKSDQSNIKETVVRSNKEPQRKFYGGSYYPEWKRVVHITLNMAWCSDMVTFNNLSPLQLNEYLYHLCMWIRFLFRSRFYILLQPLTLFYELKWKRLFSCNILTRIFTRTPTVGLNGAIILGLLLKIIFANIKRRT